MKKKEHLKPTQEPQSNDGVKQQMPVHVFLGMPINASSVEIKGKK